DSRLAAGEVRVSLPGAPCRRHAGRRAAHDPSGSGRRGGSRHGTARRLRPRRPGRGLTPLAGRRKSRDGRRRTAPPRPAPSVSRVPSSMTAVVKTRAAAGPGATEVKSVPVPRPGQAEVLLRVLATAICGSDKHIYQWDPSMAGMVRPPRIYGHEFCGEIVAFGPGGKRPHLEIGQYVS